MILVKPEHDSQSDSTSVTKMPGLSSPMGPPPPRYYLLLISMTCVVSTLAVIFVLLDVASRNIVVALPVIVAYVLTLPYQGAALLSYRSLSHRQTESSFRFNPSSQHAVAYAILLVVLWGASTAMAAVRLDFKIRTHPRYSLIDCVNSPVRTILYPMSSNSHAICPEINDPMMYWESVAAMLANSLQFQLLVTVVWVCWGHAKAAVWGSAPPSQTQTTDSSSALDVKFELA